MSSTNNDVLAAPNQTSLRQRHTIRRLHRHSGISALHLPDMGGMQTSTAVSVVDLEAHQEDLGPSRGPGETWMTFYVSSAGRKDITLTTVSQVQILSECRAVADNVNPIYRQQ